MNKKYIFQAAAKLDVSVFNFNTIINFQINKEMVVAWAGEVPAFGNESMPKFKQFQPPQASMFNNSINTLGVNTNYEINAKTQTDGIGKSSIGTSMNRVNYRTKGTNKLMGNNMLHEVRLFLTDL